MKPINCKTAILTLLVLLCSCVRENPVAEKFSFDRPWLDAPNEYVYGRPPLDYLRTVNGRVLAWSVYHGGVNDEELRYVRYLHRNGVRVSSNFATMQGSPGVVGNDRDDDFLVRTACRDFRGNPSKALWIQPDPPYLPCHNNPEWREFLMARALDHVRGEADALDIDEVEGIGGHLYEVCSGASCAGFCQWCMKGFREYLAAHFTAAALAQNFSITDIASFDYHQYLVSQGAMGLSGDPNTDLRKEYIKFQILGRREQLRDLMRAARAYAGRTLKFTANTVGLYTNYLPFVPDMDFLVFENSLDTPPQGKYIGVYALGKALGPDKHFVMFPNIINLRSMSPDDWWVFRHWIAEAAAFLSKFLIPYRAYVYGGGQSSVSGEFTVPGERIQPYTDFMKDNFQFYTGCESLARTGVLYDYQAAIEDYYAQGFIGSFMSGLPYNSYMGTTMALQEGHIPFDTLFTGDEAILPGTPSLQDLEKYSLIVVPGTKDSVARMAPLLGGYVSAGGTVVYLNGISLTYYTSGDTGIRDTIIAQVAGSGAAAAVTTDASEAISLTLYRKIGRPQIILHLVNNNYDRNARSFLSVGPITVSLSKDISRIVGDPSESVNVRIISPDYAPQAFDAPIQESGVQLTIPSVLGYTLVILEGK